MLKDKIVLITGASSGIGLACAKAFSDAGAKLMITARRLDRLQQLQQQLATEVLPVQCDISDKSAIDQMLMDLPEPWRNIDILINNAGLASGVEKFQNCSDDDIEVMIDTNVKGLLFITRRILKGMIERNNGHIINLGSIAGHEPYQNGTVYCATKAAVRSINRSLKMDCLGTKVRVSSVDPGMVHTEFSEVRLQGDSKKADKVYAGMTPLRAEDIADTILFCATRPEHVNVSEILMMPTDQASATMVHRI